jgi:hypothetical protein
LTRRLAFLNLLLVALLGATGWQFRRRWVEMALPDPRFGRLAGATQAPAAPLLEPVKPFEPASYTAVALNTMFARDRNPAVAVDAPAPPVQELIPTFPSVYGVMDIEGRVTVFMSDGRSTQQKGYRPGETVGPFQLVSATRSEFELAFKDKTFMKTLEELRPKPAQVAAAGLLPSPDQPVGAGLVPTSGTVEDGVSDRIASQAQAPLIKDGIMIDIRAVNRACAPGDTSPAGTMIAGYRKVKRPWMFGQICFWEPVR